jgi:hypothetical protein
VKHTSFFNRSKHHEQEPGQQESSQEGTRENSERKKRSKENKERSEQTAIDIARLAAK